MPEGKRVGAEIGFDTEVERYCYRTRRTFDTREKEAGDD